jgi:hypothetical protein
MKMLRDAIPGGNHLVDAATGVHARFNAGETQCVSSATGPAAREKVSSPDRGHNDADSRSAIT